MNMEDWFLIWARIYEDVMFYFGSPAWQETFFYLRIISVILSIIFGILIVYLLIKINFFGVKKEMLMQALFEKAVVLPKKKINKKWLEILRHVQSNNYRLAIIDADKLLEDIFKKMAIKGENMAQRLEKINKSQLSTIEDIWRAHKIRNYIVHDINYQLPENTAKEVIEIYKNTFKELELID